MVERLTLNGCEVVAIVRKSSPIVDKCCNVIFGNVDNYDTLKNAAYGCDAIVHIAAITSQKLLDIQQYSFNWIVAESVGKIAKELNIKKVIFVSSANAIGNGTELELATESTQLKYPYLNSLYGQSKVIAEQRLKAIFPAAIIVNPTFMIGKYDAKPSSGKIIKLGFKKRIIFMPSGGKNYVAALDVANLIVNLLKQDGVTGNFIAGGVEWTFKEFMTQMAIHFDYKTTVVVIPKFMICAAGIFGDLLRLCRIKVPFSSVNMSILNQREFYTSAKAEKIGFENSDIGVAIKNAALWMSENGVL